jgi:cbb3-type cytochrome oxidase maturation protein
MDFLYITIPISIILAGIGFGAFLWALKSGQFDDTEGDKNRIFFDEDSQ